MGDVPVFPEIGLLAPLVGNGRRFMGVLQRAQKKVLQVHILRGNDFVSGKEDGVISLNKEIARKFSLNVGLLFFYILIINNAVDPHCGHGEG